MIPLSLYVTIEMTKILQVYHIHNDPLLYDAERKKPVECRALNITEELGQVICQILYLICCYYIFVSFENRCSTYFLTKQGP